MINILGLIWKLWTNKQKVPWHLVSLVKSPYENIYTRFWASPYIGRSCYMWTYVQIYIFVYIWIYEHLYICIQIMCVCVLLSLASPSSLVRLCFPHPSSQSRSYLPRHNEGQDAPHCHGQVVVHVGGFWVQRAESCWESWDGGAIKKTTESWRNHKSLSVHEFWRNLTGF